MLKHFILPLACLWLLAGCAQPIETKPAAKPAAAKPVAEKPAATVPTATKPAAVTPAAKPAATKPATTKPATTKPAAGKGAGKKAAAKPAGGQPATAPAPVEPLKGPGALDQPVKIPHADKDIAIDGDLSDWKGVPTVPATLMKKPASGWQMCWNEKGLYGAVTVSDDKIVANPERPWKADSIELFIEKDFARSKNMTPNSVQYALNPDGSPGPAIVWSQGAPPAQKDLTCVWKPIQGGYVVEFFLSADLLNPAKLEPGTKLGFNGVANNDGKPVEQLFADKDTDKSFRTPSTWGVIELAK